MSAKIVHISDSSFDKDVLKADKPVLVDYWAEWCGPCKMIAPILEEIASEYGDRVKVCKMDIDANQQTPPRYGIRGIPTLMLFKNGEVEPCRSRNSPHSSTATSDQRVSEPEDQRTVLTFNRPNFAVDAPRRAV
jgi:thioredoxin